MQEAPPSNKYEDSEPHVFDKVKWTFTTSSIQFEAQKKLKERSNVAV